MADRPQRAAALTPLTGVLFVVLIVVGFVIAGEPPDADAPVREVVSYWVDNETEAIVGALLESIGAVALIFFAASLFRAIRRRETGVGLLSVVAFGGGIVAAAGVGVDAALRFAAADLADDVAPGVTQTINAIWADFFFPMVVGLATLVLATSLAAFRTRVVHPWLAWVGIAITIAFFTPAGFVSFLVGAAWIIVVSVQLWRQEAAGVPATGVPV